MKRDYKDSKDISDIIYFVGAEVETTPAYGKKTLFVTGVQSHEEIALNATLEGCDHIYLGANQSFKYTDVKELVTWDKMAQALLDKDFIVTLDFDSSYLQDPNFLDTVAMLSEYTKFIPQISLKIPYIQNLNYNATVKIDDNDFKSTNPGVWCHSLHELMDRKKFTDWGEYTNDKIIK